MKPLSAGKYFLENKKKTLTLFIVLVLAVAVVSFISSLILSVYKEAADANLEPLKHLSLIEASSNEIFIKDEVYEKIASFDEVDLIIEVSYQNTSFQSIMGNTSVPILIPDNKNNTQIIFNRMQINYSGKLFDETEPQIIIHEKILRNKNLKVGDYIGNDVDEAEWIFGKYNIIGSFSGSSLIGIASTNMYYDAMKNEQNLTFSKPVGLVVFPKTGKLDDMNKKIEEFTRKDCIYNTYNSINKLFNEELDSYSTIMTVIIFVVVFIVSISLSAMVYIIYMNRSEEFGILYAMGYKKSFIYKLIFFELILISAVSWALGYLFSWGLFAVLNLSLAASGQTLYFFTTTGLINTFIVPVMVIICSSLPVVRKLRKWDPISVIERKEI